MRSEEEIREKLENKEKVKIALGLDKPPMDYEMSIFKWVLEGEPRYSVVELEKLHYHLAMEHPTESTTYKEFHALLKDKKRVEGILNAKDN